MISKDQAADIARTMLGKTIELDIYPERPDTFRGYDAPRSGCWYVYCKMPGEEQALKSSRVICVNKDTGKVVWHGSANDEG